MKTTLSVASLKAMLAFAQDHTQSRPYLHGIHVEVQRGCNLLVATDGNMLAVLRQDHLDGADVELGMTVIPYGAIKALKKDKKLPGVSVSLEGESLTLADHSGPKTVPAIMDKFPDWRKVIPRGALSDVPGQGFKASLLATFDAFANAMGTLSDSDAVRIFHDGDQKSVLVKMQRTDFFAVLMPIYFKKVEDEVKPGIPDWIDPPKAEEIEEDSCEDLV